MALTLNERAQRLADHLSANSSTFRIAVHHMSGQARVLDCGVAVPGGLQAGLILARICLAGCAEVGLWPGEIAGTPSPLVSVATDQPVLACMASQYAGWQVSVGKFFGMGSGPMRAQYGREDVFDKIPGREKAPVAVGVLETRKLPDDAVVEHLCQKLELPPEKLTLLAAPAGSMAGTMQVVARSVETAMHKLHELGFDLNQVVSGYGVAPLPPVGADDLQAIGRTNDAILYGGRVNLWVSAEESELAALGPKVPSSASPDHGVPFADIFKRCQGDFYKIDPMLFSPAQIVFHNLRTGASLAFGHLEPEVLKDSFFSKP
jgi:methenyltetrahydromethanopterin cyclohydrolase